MSEQTETVVSDKVVAVPSVAMGTDKKNNTGVIILSITLVITCMIIMYFVFFDKKSPRMNNGSAMPFMNNKGLNSLNISSNGGYGYKANAY
jgi:hypothetical protein